MLTFAPFQVAYSNGVAGSGRRAGRSSSANRLARDPGSFLNGRLFSQATRSRIARFASAGGEERPIAEGCEGPALGDEDAGLDLRPVPGLVEESACYRCGRPRIGKIEPFTFGNASRRART